MILTTLIVIGVIAATVLLRGMITPKPAARAANTRSGRVTKKTAESAVGTRLPYHAISCRSGAGNCAAVEALKDQRFLVEDAPQLPLADCTSSERCKCKYLHHEDRRDTDDDRRALYGIKSEFYEYTSKQDRRVKNGRRESDWEVEQSYGQI
jgi:hypothetical protein